MKTVAMVVLVVVCLLSITWLIQGNDFFMFKVFAPRYANVQREVFENTKSYQQGMIQELYAMQWEYEQADDAHKAALADLILHRVADFPEGDLPSDLQAFITKLKAIKTY